MWHAIPRRDGECRLSRHGSSSDWRPVSRDRWFFSTLVVGIAGTGDVKAMGRVGLGGVSYLISVPFLSFARAIGEPFLLAFTTASSEPALPKAPEVMERFGTTLYLWRGRSYCLVSTICWTWAERL